MEVIIARTSGFCGGVKRAMRLALSAAAGHGGVRADGPLVHNRQALELLALHGVVDAPLSERPDLPVLVRAHGVPPEKRLAWLEAGLELVDATCPHVARNQALAARAAARGDRVVLAGDPEHAETLAVSASAGPDCAVVTGPADVERLPQEGRVTLLAQTTFNVETFAAIGRAARRRFRECEIVDTICRATHERQAEAAAVARRVDAMVVVGGADSANTRRLADTAAGAGIPVFQVETAADLRPADFAGFARVGVTSGASTPGWITQEAVNRLRSMGRGRLRDRLLFLLHQAAESRVLTTFSALGMALAAQFFVLREMRPESAIAGGCYVFFAHTLNRRVPTHPEARRLSLVDSFYQNRRSGLLFAAWTALAAALALSLSAGTGEFLLFAAASAAAAAYSWASRRPSAAGSPPRFLTYPRNQAMGLGWGLVLAGPPWMESGFSMAGAGAVLFIFLLCLGGTVSRDLHDVASDGLLGIGTLPSRIGPGRAERLARVSLLLATFLPLAAATAAVAAGGEGFSPWFAFTVLMPFAPGLGLLLLEAAARGRTGDAVLLQAGVDGMGCLAGCLALAGGIWT